MSRKIVIAATLRHNITLPDDVKLAEREFRALTGARDVRVLKSWRDYSETSFPELPPAIMARIQSHLRGDGPTGFCALADKGAFQRLVRQSAFFQDVAAPCAVTASPLIARHSTISLGVTAAALGEYASVLVDGSGANNRNLLEALRAFLLRGVEGGRAVEAAISGKRSTLALSHDLHIYKAKFFPRMVRSLLNVYGVEGEEDTVLDPFSGSGTALLEASALGLPSLGLDADPLSAMISENKVTPFTSDRTSTRDLLRRVLSALDDSPLFRAPEGPSVIPDELRAKLARRDKKYETSFLAEIDADLRRLSGLRQAVSVGRSSLLDVLLSDAVTKKVRYRFVGVGNGRYTIEVVRQTVLERFEEKVRATLALCDTFEWLEVDCGVKFAASTARVGDARRLLESTSDVRVGACVTSPPYLPASSGREHYAASRALAFNLTGISQDEVDASFVGHVVGAAPGCFDPASLTPAGAKLLRYLLSDSDRADPQRDAMRFERKAVPTWCYLHDIEKFLSQLRRTSCGVCLLVVAAEHVFYSHRRQQEAKSAGRDPVDDGAVEYVANSAELYGELAARAGWKLEEDIRIGLAKSAVSMARPRSSEDYAETVLVLRPV